MKNPLALLINEHISCGERSFYDLSDSDKEELTALYIQSNKDRNSFLMEHSDYETVINLLVLYMKDSDADKKEIMINLMKNIAVEAYEDDLAKIFDDAIIHRDHSEKFDRGLRQYTYKDNGETYWA